MQIWERGGVATTASNFPQFERSLHTHFPGQVTPYAALHCTPCTAVAQLMHTPGDDPGPGSLPLPLPPAGRQQGLPRPLPPRGHRLPRARQGGFRGSINVLYIILSLNLTIQNKTRELVLPDLFH
jgi:hypothetical protein